MKDQPWKKQGPKPKRYPYKGQMLTVAQLAKLSGWSTKTIYERIGTGQPAEEAVRRHPKKPPPPNPDSLIVSYRGEERTLAEWVKLDWVKSRKITKAKLYARLFQLGWAKEEAFGDAPRLRPDQQIITVQTPDGPVWKTLKDWSRYLGIAESKISRRLSLGWTEEQALGYESRPRITRRFIVVQTSEGAVKKSLSEWVAYTGLPKRTILTRLSRGWTNEQAMGYEPSPSELRYGDQSERDDDVNG